MENTRAKPPRGFRLRTQRRAREIGLSHRQAKKLAKRMIRAEKATAARRLAEAEYAARAAGPNGIATVWPDTSQARLDELSAKANSEVQSMIDRLKAAGASQKERGQA